MVTGRSTPSCTTTRTSAPRAWAVAVKSVSELPTSDSSTDTSNSIGSTGIDSVGPVSGFVSLRHDLDG